MVDSPLHCDYATVTQWIALRSGLKSLVTAAAPLISAKVRRAGNSAAAGWLCIAGLLSKIAADAAIGLSRTKAVIFSGD